MSLTITTIKRTAIPILKRNGVVKAGIFGSTARGDNKKKSDIDFLVQFKAGKSLLDLIGLEQELKKALKNDVDVVTYKSLNRLIKEKALQDEVRIL